MFELQIDAKYLKHISNLKAITNKQTLSPFDYAVNITVRVKKRDVKIKCVSFLIR
jgi:hypothetical protein